MAVKPQMKRKSAICQYTFETSFQVSAGLFSLFLHTSALVYVLVGGSELYTTETICFTYIQIKQPSVMRI